MLFCIRFCHNCMDFVKNFAGKSLFPCFINSDGLFLNKREGHDKNKITKMIGCKGIFFRMGGTKMENKTLWSQYEGWKNEYQWVDLTHELSSETPCWQGFSKMETETPFTYAGGFLTHQYKVISQYGTHVDAPSHFVEGKRGLDEIKPSEMVLPLCVIDISKDVADFPDMALSVKQIENWEWKHGNIPPKAFVALRTDWWKKRDMDQCDQKGVKHFPGWSMEALKFLVEKRDVVAIGHETSDTDAGIDSAKRGYTGEYYILEQERYQIELMRNLDQVPPVGSLIFCGFPKVKDGVGFTARCIALCPLY